MSRNHAVYKNIPWPNILKLFAYNTEKPETLSKKQLVSRLYKNVLRTSYNRVYRGLYAESRQFFRRQTSEFRRDFERMLVIDRDSKEFNNYLLKYEDYLTENYDITMLVFDNQSNSLNSAKETFYNDEVI